MLLDQVQYLRVQDDNFYDTLDQEQLTQEYERIDEELPPNLSLEDLKQDLKKFHRRRSLACWHDGSTVSNHSHLLITFNTIYDTAIFLTCQEYKDKTGFFFVSCI